MTVRYDSVTLPSARIDADGFLYDTPVLTRSGVFKYRNPDGSTRREYRPPEEVFRADSLASYRGKPITVWHPAEGKVTTKNARRVMVGTIISAGRQDGADLLADIVIHDVAAIGTQRALSVGYRLDYEPGPGVAPNGEAYDGVQRNIVVNHLSVVPSARAGREARLNLDGDEIFEEESEEKETMPKIRLDNGIEYDAAPEVVVAYEKLRNDNSDLNTKLTTVNKNLDAMTAERDGLKAKVDAHPAELEKIRKDAADKQDSAVKARVELLDTAKNFRIDKADEMADKDIKIAVITAVRGDGFDPKDKSDAYIEAAFDLAKADKRNDAMASQRQKINPPPTGTRTDDDGPKTSAEARDRMIAGMENAYKGDKGGK